MPGPRDKYTFVGRCQSERFGTIKIGYTKKDLKLMENNIAQGGWGNVRIKFRQSDNEPMMVLVPPFKKPNGPDREAMPSEDSEGQDDTVQAPEEATRKVTPF